jgi:hypothetical protein
MFGNNTNRSELHSLHEEIKSRLNSGMLATFGSDSFVFPPAV